VVAAKSLLATALVALVLTQAAAADTPTVMITNAAQAKAVGGLLRLSDLGEGWQGGETKPSSLVPLSCPGFDPTRTGLVVKGHADARFTFAPGGVVLEQDVVVLANPAQVRADFARTFTPGLAPCLAYRLSHSPHVVSATVQRVPFPPAGSVTVAYRATVLVRSGHLRSLLLSDFIFFAAGKVEYAFNLVAPLETQNQLMRFEVALAQALMRRAGGR
jgi:hypothetical protein